MQPHPKLSTPKPKITILNLVNLITLCSLAVRSQPPSSSQVGVLLGFCRDSLMLTSLLLSFGLFDAFFATLMWFWLGVWMYGLTLISLFCVFRNRCFWGDACLCSCSLAYACFMLAEIKSRTCREPSNYTGLRYDPLNLDLGVCYNPSAMKDFYNWVSLSNKRGMFISTYYVSCPHGDPDCQTKCKDMSADDIRNVSI